MPESSDFWSYAWDGGEGSSAEEREIKIDVEGRKVSVNVDGTWKEWTFQLSGMELGLTVNKGVSSAFNRYGRGIWAEMMKNGAETGSNEVGTGNKGGQNVGQVEEGANVMEKEIQW
jgi:hypothetical protein